MIEKECANRIFFEELPRWENGKNIGKIKWQNVNEYPLRLVYDKTIYECRISYIKNRRKFSVTYGENTIIRNSNAIYRIKPEDILGIIEPRNYKAFIYGVGDRIVKDGLDISIIGRFRADDKNKTKRYLLKCNRCGFDSSKSAFRLGKVIRYSITESNLINLTMCPCCHGRVTQTGINDAATTAPDIVRFFKEKDEAYIYTSYSNHKVACICPDCGTEKKNKISINQLNKFKHISCVCGNTISLPERIMYHVLNKSAVVRGSFKYQYSPSWCVFDYNGTSRNGIYDFYFCHKNKEYVIEMDGAFHYQKNYRDQSIPQENIDRNKDLLAKANGHIVIRIDCRVSDFSYIKRNIVDSLDDEIIEGIDWEDIERLSLSNLTKAICEDYEDHKSQDDVMSYLEEKYHFSRGNIISHLHKGNKYGWCNYDSHPQWKRVFQFDSDGNLLHEYASCNQAIRESGISDLNFILLGKIRQQPPYIWSYDKQIGENGFDSA